ncbi:MAG: hypothetical protein IPJ41_02480 [Phycisphaerales bacterium]|nr:hypothetical protein [Phycisphaerales bacterium]
MINAQLLCGAGIEETKRNLGSPTGPEAAEALAYLEKCEASGFAHFTPSEHLEHDKRYFRYMSVVGRRPTPYAAPLAPAR